MINTKLLHGFVANWTGKGYEKGESQPFWMALLRAFGIEEPDQFINYEQQVHLDHTAFIDGYIPSTKVMIDHVTFYNFTNQYGALFVSGSTQNTVTNSIFMNPAGGANTYNAVYAGGAM